MEAQRREIIADLLLQWEEQYQRGQDVPASELAREYPEVVEELARRIKAMKATTWLASPLTASPSPDSDPPHEASARRTLANRYRLDELIALGGFAEVWRAYDKELQRSVAVKIPKAGQGEYAESFMAEARRVARLRHSAIVPVFDVGREDDQCFIVSDFMDGGSLATRLAKAPVTPGQAVEWIARIADALEYAHLNGVIHRDVKPANILINHHDEALLGDFGIAQSANKTGRFDPSLGTLFYMSPEQLEGRPITPASDVFGLAVVLYEALSREMPYSSSDPNVIRREITTGWKKPWPPSIPQQLVPVLNKAMNRNPQQRHNSAAHFGADLKRAWNSAPRRRWLPWAAIAVGLGVVGALTMLALRSSTPRDRKVGEARADILPADLRKDLGQTATAVRSMTERIVTQKADEDLQALLAIDLIRVEGGTLPEGSKLAGTAVPDFLLSNHEVTIQEWRDVLPYARQNGYELTNEGRGSEPNGPVAWITWFDAVLWCNARSEQAGLMPVYQESGDGRILKRKQTIPTMNPRANGYRLPTYAEWEWAATGGVRSKGFLYSGSSNLDEVAWCPRNPSRAVAVVCRKRPNELGIYDMTGNVREWCWSTLDEGPEPNNRIAAGGGVMFEHDDDHDVRSRTYARRLDTTQTDLGFRVARNAP